MKVTAIYETEPGKPRRKKQKRNLARKICCAVLIAITATGLAFNQKHEEVVMADDAQVYVVQDGDTIWDIARPIADARGEDIRETIYQIMVNNSIGPDDDLKPGQILTIK